MIPKIIIKKEFNVIGMSCRTTLKNNKVPELWKSFMSRVGEIRNRVNPGAALVTVGLSEYAPGVPVSVFSEETVFSYLACVEVSRIESIPPEMVGKTIPASRYAVFTHRGPMDTLGNTYNYIYGTWLPNSGFMLAEADDFELYDGRFKGKINDCLEIDIYVPIT